MRSHLQVARKDDNVVAYWVLDDYPGDVRPMSSHLACRRFSRDGSLRAA